MENKELKADWSNQKVEHAAIHDLVFQHCDLNNVSIENCSVRGLKINGIHLEDLFNSYYANQKAPLIDMAREL